MQWKILAGLRFFLALIVVGDHIIDLFPEAGEPWNTLSRLGGFPAVLGFLLISGYSIANSITQKPEGFYKRRFLRIYPLYACSIFISLIPFLVLGSKINLIFNGVFAQFSLDFQTVIGNLFMMQGFFVQFIGSNPPLWTLSIECCCYLLAPFFVKLSTKALLTLIGLSSILFAIYPYFIKLEIIQLKVYDYSFLIYGLGFCLLLWAWLLGFLYFREKEKIAILIIALGCLLLEQNQVITSRWAILTYVLSASLLIYSSNLKFPPSLLKIFSYLGELSYPLYLFHIPSLIFGYAVLGIEKPIVLVFFSLAISMFFDRVIDRVVHFQNSTKFKTLLLRILP